MEQPLLEVAVERFADAIAYCDQRTRVTYQQLSADVDHRHRQILAGGVQPSTRVAWCPKNDYSTLVNLWAILHAGGVACPISHRFPVSKREQCIVRLGARWLETCLGSDHQMPVASARDLDSAATIVLSSGSSGEPKAVVHSLRAHIASAEGASSQIPLAPGDGWLWALPTFHVGGLSIPVRCALAGAAVRGVDPHSTDLSSCVEDRAVSHVSLVPAQLRRLLDSPASMSHLRAVLLGGMVSPESLLEQAVERGIPVHTTYGMTEMASQVTTSSRLQAAAASCGRVLPGREMCIGPHDEILVRGQTLCLGYVTVDGMDAVTDKDGWFHTGDRGRVLDSGELEVLGRMDNMFVSGGENIYPESIEARLLQIAEIRQAVVVPKRDREFGQRPVAFVDAGAFDVENWNLRLREQLAGYEIPKAYFPWPHDVELAIKPDRRHLKQLAAQLNVRRPP